MADVDGLFGGDVATREPQQAGLVEGVAQRGVLGEVFQGAGMVEAVVVARGLLDSHCSGVVRCQKSDL